MHNNLSLQQIEILAGESIVWAVIFFFFVKAPEIVAWLVNYLSIGISGYGMVYRPIVYM